MRTKSARVQDIELDLRERLRNVSQAPGERFFSGHVVANRYGIAYRTAHKILKEMEKEGLLSRRVGSGSYLPGSRPPARVRLVFPPSSRTVNNAIFYTFDSLVENLKSQGIDFHVTYTSRWRGGAKNEYFVFYGDVRDQIPYLENVKQALHIYNTHKIPKGLIPALDVISVDHFEAGRIAAGFLRDKVGLEARVAFFHGPIAQNAQERMTGGFLQVFPNARIFASEQRVNVGFTKVATRVARERLDGVFCSNTGVGRELLRACIAAGESAPRLICFDNYKFSEKHRLSVVQAPYKDVAAAALSIIINRMKGDSSPPSHVVFKPVLIERDS